VTFSLVIIIVWVVWVVLIGIVSKILIEVGRKIEDKN